MTNEELIHEFFRRSDAGDVDGLLELFSNDCSYSTIQLERDLRGKAELADLFRRNLDGLRSHREWATNVIVEGDVAGSEVHLEGVSSAGREVVLDSLNVWDFDDGRIRRIRVYPDTAPIAAALA